MLGTGFYVLLKDIKINLNPNSNIEDEEFY